ncbi:DUF4382 domain-containing protein [Parapedobacter deserti]|uniref:DUF4382 domain-containing protein n=1 Tax=Parapedobacter deserti TaxID=1912957 RepID=A0ABV7JP04_9SPHI
MKSMRFVLPLLAIGCAVLFSAACSKRDSHSAGTAKLDLRLTDAPGAFDAVYLDVQGIQFHVDGSGWISVDPVVPGTYDLLKFRNGADTLLARAELPAGRLSQVRLILGGANGIVVDGTEYPLDVPSGQQSGLKLNVHEELAPNGSYEMWTDFDAARSIVQTGNGSYKLKPLIRVFTRLTDGQIKGFVAPMEANPIIYAINGADTASAFPNPDGFFLIRGLPEGSYTLRIEADKTAGLAVYEQSVSVSFGEISNVQTITLTAGSAD